MINSKYYLFSFLSIITFLVYASSLNAQSTYEFEQEKNSGKVPLIFTMSLSKYQNIPLSNVKQTGDFQKDKKLLFQRNYNKSLYELFWKGNILFGDNYSAYLNEIKNKILEDNKLEGLKSEITIYTWKTISDKPLVLLDGSILLPTSIIMSVQNEAQLAFLLSEQIVKYQWLVGSGYVSFLNRVSVNEIKRYSSNLVYKTNENFALKLNYFDEKAYDLYKLTNYNQEDAIDALIVMQYLELFQNESELESNFFDTKFATLPTFFKIENNDNKKIETAVGDKLSDSRLTSLTKLVNFREGKKYVIGQVKFNKVIRDVRYEHVQILFEKSKYEECINFVAKLSKDDGYSDYLLKAVNNSLYLMAKNKSSFGSDRNSNSLSYFELRKKESKISLTIPADYGVTINKSMVSKIKSFSSKDEFLVFTINYLQSGNKNGLFDNYINDLLYELIHIEKIDINSSLFNVESVTQKVNDTNLTNNLMKIKNYNVELTSQYNKDSIEKVIFNPLDSLVYAGLSKVEKINYQRKKIDYNNYLTKLKDKKRKDSLKFIPKKDEGVKKNYKREEMTQFISQSFKNWSKDSILWQRVTEIKEMDSSINYPVFVSNQTIKPISELKNTQIEINLIDSILIMPVVYNMSDKRYLFAKDLSEEQSYKQDKLEENVGIVLKSEGYNFCSSFMTQSDSINADKVNDILLINKWQNDVRLITDRLYTFSEYSVNEEIRKKYNYLFTVSVSSERVSRNPWMLGVGVILLVGAPFAIGLYVIPKYHVSKSIIITDLDGNEIYRTAITPNNRPNAVLDMLFLKDAISQINKNKK